MYGVCMHLDTRTCMHTHAHTHTPAYYVHCILLVIAHNIPFCHVMCAHSELSERKWETERYIVVGRGGVGVGDKQQNIQLIHILSNLLYYRA